MKTIENKVTEIISGTPDQPKMMTYVDLCKLIINQPSQEGFTVEQIRQRLTIFGVLTVTENPEKVEIEVKDFTALKEVINKFKWAQVHKDIVAFVDYINSL